MESQKLYVVRDLVLPRFYSVIYNTFFQFFTGDFDNYIYQLNKLHIFITRAWHPSECSRWLIVKINIQRRTKYILSSAVFIFTINFIQNHILKKHYFKVNSWLIDFDDIFTNKSESVCIIRWFKYPRFKYKLKLVVFKSTIIFSFVLTRALLNFLDYQIMLCKTTFHSGWFC